MRSASRLGAWRAREAVREGMANLVSGRWTTAILLLFAGYGIGIPAAIDAAFLTDVARDEAAFIAAGGYVLVASNDDHGGVDAVTCDALRGIAGVRAAVALTRRDGTAAFGHAPGQQLTTVEATAGVFDLLGLPDPPQPAVVVPSDIAERAGLASGAAVTLSGSTDDGDALISELALHAAVTDTTLVGDAMSTGLLVPAVPRGNAERCLVAAEAAAYQSLGESLGVLLAAGEHVAVVHDLVPRGPFARDFAKDLTSRSLRAAFLGSGAVLAAAWFLVRWTRRSQDALYATLGTGTRDHIIIRGTEWLALLALATPWGFALGVLGGLALGADTSIAVQVTVRYGAGTCLTATGFVAVGLLLRPRSLLSTLRDR